MKTGLKTKSNNGWHDVPGLERCSVLLADGAPIRVSITQDEHERSVPDAIIAARIMGLTSLRCRIVGGIAAWERGERPGEAVARMEVW